MAPRLLLLLVVGAWRRGLRFSPSCQPEPAAPSGPQDTPAATAGGRRGARDASVTAGQPPPSACTVGRAAAGPRGTRAPSLPRCRGRQSPRAPTSRRHTASPARSHQLPEAAATHVEAARRCHPPSRSRGAPTRLRGAPAAPERQTRPRCLRAAPSARWLRLGTWRLRLPSEGRGQSRPRLLSPRDGVRRRSTRCGLHGCRPGRVGAA